MLYDVISVGLDVGLDGTRLDPAVLQQMAAAAVDLPVTVNFGRVAVGKIVAAHVIRDRLVVRLALPQMHMLQLPEAKHQVGALPFGTIEHFELDSAGFRVIDNFSLMGLTLAPVENPELALTPVEDEHEQQQPPVG